MKKLPFNLKKVPDDLAKALSGIAVIGDDLWLGGDEGTSVVRATRAKNSGYIADPPQSLAARLDLPGDETDEIDIEGLDVSTDDGVPYLWVVGSHSLKRKKPEEPDPEEEMTEEELIEFEAKNVKRLGKIEADGNRCLLARLPLKTTGRKTRLLEVDEYTAEHFGARLPCTGRTSDLLDQLWDDPLFSLFLHASVPGKDNGVDFGGLACVAGTRRLLIGLRGPVLRGWAVLLEIEVKAEFRGDGEPGRLKLKKVGPDDDRRYLRHFLDLGGLGIRDFCFEPNGDLLILAGPTMVLDWPPTVFRWSGASAALGARESFIRQKPGPLTVVLDERTPPPPSGYDRPEGLARWGDGQVLVLYDNPSKERLRNGILDADVFGK